MNRRIALVVALAAVVAALTAGVALAAKHAPKAKAQAITVTMTDYHFKLSKSVVKKGAPVVFTVVNKGKTVHNFDLQGYKATPISAPGVKKLMKVTFKKAGKVQYVCDVPRHAELGMSGSITVK